MKLITYIPLENKKLQLMGGVDSLARSQTPAGVLPHTCREGFGGRVLDTVSVL